MSLVSFVLQSNIDTDSGLSFADIIAAILAEISRFNSSIYRSHKTLSCAPIRSNTAMSFNLSFMAICLNTTVSVPAIYLKPS